MISRRKSLFKFRVSWLFRSEAQASPEWRMQHSDRKSTVFGCCDGHAPAGLRKGDSYVFNGLSRRIINISLHMRSTIACETNDRCHNRKCYADPRKSHESP